MYEEYRSIRQSNSHAIRNTLVLSFAFLFVFTAYMAIQALQSSLNQEEGLGVTSLSTLYAFIILSGILSPVIMKSIVCKNVLIVAWVCHVIYTATNFYPAWGTLIPSSVLLGIVSGPMWASQGLYISSYAYSLAAEKQVDVSICLSRLNGIFFAFFLDN